MYAGSRLNDINYKNCPGPDQISNIFFMYYKFVFVDSFINGI
jgi:hypothetical protein